MRFTLLTQIALLVISTVIALAFIRPAFEDIRAKQDEHFKYEDAVVKAGELNSALQELISRRDAFSQRDREVLDTFVPTHIDSLKVMRDIEGIFLQLGKPIIALSAGEVVAPQDASVFADGQLAVPQVVQSGTPVTTQDFDFSFVGNYPEIKGLLSMLERNETLLEVMSLSFEPVPVNISDENRSNDVPEGVFTVNVTVRTYALSPALQ